ncbi:MAG: pyruvate formate-lyase-activating protein [Alphaproteobacteria bacterium]|nr:pyruvate formate-lyase-activating protein [Alphaproteobacteria bacterium]
MMKEQLQPGEGYIHSVETAGAVDGPGLRFVVFVSGCPLRCLYCHNPDSRNMKDGKKTTAKEIISEIAKYSDFLMRTGGGVTVSGGEPLFQQDFVTEIFKECKKIGLHTALDTSGYLGKQVKAELLDVTDLVLLDIKSFDSMLYKQITGLTLQPTLDFAERLSIMGKPMWIRYVLVPNLTDDLALIDKLADFVSKLKSAERVEVLPFHKMGEQKWEALNLDYKLHDTQPPSQELIDRVKRIFTDRDLIVS